MPDDKGNVSESEKAQLAVDRGTAAAKISDPDERRKFIAEQGDKEGSKKLKTDDKGNVSSRLGLMDYVNLNHGAAERSYKHGTDYVPKTGPAVLHKGEAVLKKEDAEKYRKHLSHLSSELGGADEKPPKEIDHIRTRKAKSGGYIHEHHHTRPEHHPMEQHVSADQDAMVGHMMEHLGEQNPGEAQADLGHSGIEELTAPSA